MIGRARRAVSRWLAQSWVDLKASTDASLLGILRFVGLLYGPIDRHLRIDQALRKALRYRLAGHVGWRHAFGGITYLLFIVLVVTGVLLSFYYRPSAEEAYRSIQHIVSRVSLGWLIRDVHVWSANLIVIAALAHMARVFLEAAYKPPRETNWLVGLLLLFVVLAFGATGYLLPWDQWAYWTVTEALDAVAGLPVVGGAVVEVLTGDVLISGATLSRFFALHVVVLPWIALGLLVLHFTMIRKHGVAPPRDPQASSETGIAFFPNQLLRSFIVSVFVLAVVVTLAVLYPRPVGEPANPYSVPQELVSTWVPVDVSIALIRYLGSWGFTFFTLLGLSLALLPLFDRRPERRLRHRPVVVALGLTFLLGFATAWLAGRQLRSMPPTARPGPEVLEERVRPAAPGLPLPEIGPAPLRPAPSPDTPGARSRGEP